MKGFAFLRLNVKVAKRNYTVGNGLLLKQPPSLFGLPLLSSYQPSKRSLWGKLDRSREYTPNAVRSVHMTEVKILPYRPPARLIRCLVNGKREQFNSCNASWFAVTDILLAKGNELN